MGVLVLNASLTPGGCRSKSTLFEPPSQRSRCPFQGLLSVAVGDERAGEVLGFFLQERQPAFGMLFSALAALLLLIEMGLGRGQGRLALFERGFLLATHRLGLRQPVRLFRQVRLQTTRPLQLLLDPCALLLQTAQHGCVLSQPPAPQLFVLPAALARTSDR